MKGSLPLFALLFLKTILPAQDHVVSLLGDTLHPRGGNDSLLFVLDTQLAADSNNLQLLHARGRALDDAWRYPEAIAVFSRCIRLDPVNPLFYRRRGHRYLSIRRFDQAVTDLEVARTLFNDPDTSWRKGWADQLPRLEFEIYYHLGLAYFLTGDYEEARQAYTQCYSVATDQASKVSAGYWLASCLLRLNRPRDLVLFLYTFPTSWKLTTNRTYYHLLLLFKGVISEEEMLRPERFDRFEIAAFGVANWRAFREDWQGALDMYRQTLTDPHWPGFGYLGAEVEIWRNENKE